MIKLVVTNCFHNNNTKTFGVLYVHGNLAQPYIENGHWTRYTSGRHEQSQLRTFWSDVFASVFFSVWHRLFAQISCMLTDRSLRCIKQQIVCDFQKGNSGVFTYSSNIGSFICHNVRIPNSCLVGLGTLDSHFPLANHEFFYVLHTSEICISLKSMRKWYK